jgi:nicotinate phosphoribosyltransferase
LNYTPLLTDQYQLVMAYSYWKLGMAEQEAVFHLSFRTLPHNKQFIVASGLHAAIDFMQQFIFNQDDLAYLAAQQNENGPLFDPAFLTYLQQLRFTCDVDAIPEGTLVFAKEPLIRIKGPIIQGQLLETALINFINFGTLITTKAANVYQAAQGDPVIEFGLRRAQGPDGGLTASRSAYIGGCTATSNVLAGKLFGIPIQGTQAHSWIMAFPNELAAFRGFADVMADQTILLVDTYDTIQGIKNAITVGQELQKKGHHLRGIRLDSGDLLTLSQQGRQLLDAAGFTETKIIASGDLDEYIIHDLKVKQAPIDSWGVGTRLVTAYDQPSLNAIYKLSAIKNSHGTWDYKMKISNTPDKSTLPGIQQVRRYQNQKDVIYDIELDTNLVAGEDLLQPIFRAGQLCYTLPSIDQIRAHCLESVSNFSHATIPYPVVIAPKLDMLTAIIA